MKGHPAWDGGLVPIHIIKLHLCICINDFGEPEGDHTAVDGPQQVPVSRNISFRSEQGSQTSAISASGSAQSVLNQLYLHSHYHVLGQLQQQQAAKPSHEKQITEQGRHLCNATKEDSASKSRLRSCEHRSQNCQKEPECRRLKQKASALFSILNVW